MHSPGVTRLLALALLAGGWGARAALPLEQRVNVTFYGEALCPYCARLTVTTIADFMRSPLANLTRFEYVPYGNARQTQAGVVCQHGEDECRLNRLFACAIHEKPFQLGWFPFLHCVEDKLAAGGGDMALGELEPQFKGCALDSAYDWQSLQRCATGPEGAHLIKHAANRTAALDPPHTYVPWLTVNGYPLGDKTDLLEDFVCVALPAGERPSACFSGLSRPAPPREHQAPAAALGRLARAAGRLERLFLG